MNPLYVTRARLVCFANDNTAFIPELWANEGLAILQENMVIANLVHRDFENEIRQFGDVVNTRRPGTFQIRRKADGIALSNQDAQATNVQVPLNQWFYNSFTILDGEASQSFQDLVDIYLRPGMITIARSVDRAVLGQVHQFLNGGVNGVPSYVGNPYARVGRLGNLNAANSKDYVLEARQQLNVNKAPLEGRNLVLAPVSETALLKNELFVAAQQRGDFGTALESATLGRILGFDTYMDQNVNSATPTDVVAGTVTAAVAAGTTMAGAVTLAGTYSVNPGEFCVVAGNDQPTWAIAGSTDGTLTLNEPNKYATPAVAAISVYKACQTGAAYAAGWVSGIVLAATGGDPTFAAPAIGQLLSFGTTPASRVNYTVIESYLDPQNGNAVTVILDRPLAAGLTSGQLAFPGPAGAMNLAFHRNAIALVTRPLAIPNNAMGVLSHVGVYNDIAMRVSMQYSIANGGTVVNLDILAGVAVLDTNLAVVLQG
jgi:hypothetical protein